jgi:hypothetical protein
MQVPVNLNNDDQVQQLSDLIEWAAEQHGQKHNGQMLARLVEDCVSEDRYEEYSEEIQDRDDEIEDLRRMVRAFTISVMDEFWEEGSAKQILTEYVKQLKWLMEEKFAASAGDLARDSQLFRKRVEDAEIGIKSLSAFHQVAEGALRAMPDDESDPNDDYDDELDLIDEDPVESKGPARVVCAANYQFSQAESHWCGVGKRGRKLIMGPVRSCQKTARRDAWTLHHFGKVF